MGNCLLSGELGRKSDMAVVSVMYLCECIGGVSATLKERELEE